MVEDLTVLLVGDDEPDEKLAQQLAKKNLNVEISTKSELGSLLALVEPHIVVHIGKDGAEETVKLLREMEAVRRVRLIVLAERDALSDLRKLDRTVVVSLLANDIAPSVVAARVLMLAKKGPEKSLRPPSAAAQPPRKAAPAPKPEAKPAPAATAKIEMATPPAAKFALASAATVPPKAVPPKAAPPEAGSQKEEPAPDSSGPESELPTMAIDLSIPQEARPAEVEVRVVLADDDVTRADLIACALRAANIPTRIVPLDAAKTHWPLVRQFAPTIVIGDGNALKTTGQIWLQLFQADQALKRAKVVAVPFDRLCLVDEGAVNLRTLIPQIPQLSNELAASSKPTSGPNQPKDPLSSPAFAMPKVEAPIPFEDDDPDEFERLTVARPIDAPLPTEATRSRLPHLPQPGPAAGTPAAPVVKDEPSSPRPVSNDGPRPVFDSLAPIADLEQDVRPALGAPAPAPNRPQTDTPQTPAATQTTANPPKKKSGGGKFALVAVIFLVLGSAGGWLALGEKLPPFLRLGPQTSASASQPKQKSPPAPKIPEIPETPPPDENAPTPEQLLWRVHSTPSPNCVELVPNLEELKVGGIQQAAVSLGKARQSMVLGRLDEALTLMCEAVLVHPESLALEELAALYLTKGSPEQALQWYEKAKELRPDRARTLELGGDIHSQLGNVAEAKAAFVASLKVKPDDEKTLKAVSKQFSEQGDQEFRGGAFSNAALIYRRAATLDQENAEAFAGLTATSAAAGNAQAATRWAEKTLLLDDGHHVALVVQAALASEAGDNERASELTEKAIDRNPNYLPAHQLRQKLKGE